MIDKYGGVDVLVNNARISFNSSSTNSFGDQVNTLHQFLGTTQVCDILFPIIKPGARVVNMSSSARFLRRIQLGIQDKAKNDELK